MGQFAAAHGLGGSNEIGMREGILGLGVMASTKNKDPFEEEDDNEGDPCLEPDWCDHCQGRGKVTTADYESYYGANYKPCPKCFGNPCGEEPPIS